MSSYKDKIQRVLAGDGDPDSQTRGPESDERDGRGFTSFQTGGDVERRKTPEDTLGKYWRQYETTGIVKKSINTYANDIIEPGYTVHSENEELEQQMEQWLREGVIANGVPDKDFLVLLEDLIKQREVRGTALIEIVPQESNRDGIWGFRLINVESVNAIEKESSGLLVRPEETDLDDVPITRRGEAAAYIQYDDQAFGGPFDEDDVPLSQNDVLKFVLDGDAYDVFGTSRLEGVSDDIKTLNKILDDNAGAIAAKGHPYWIFKMGEPNGDSDNPRAGVWPNDKIQALRDEHKAKNFSAGQKDFLPGDVDVNVVHGETADIKPTVNYHTEQILASMPTPKFMVGFSDAVNRDITTEQFDAYKTQVRKARRELENGFRPALKRKAEEWGYDGEAVESLELSIEREVQDNPLENNEFEAQEFKAMAEGLRSLEQSSSVSMAEIRENFLGLPAEQADSPDDGGSDDSEQTVEEDN